jgi:hypothetical protein
MAITVYASTASINAQYDNLTDAEKAQADLTTTQALFAEAVDDSDPSASFSFNWSILDSPSGSNASFSDSSVQNPTLNNIDIWGNYRIMVIATNSTTGETSATDQIVAPNSSFVTVRVNSTNRGLEKPAKGERDWHTKAHEWVSAIDDTELNDLTGVSLGTLSNGEFLKYNGNNWINAVPSGGNIEVTVGATTETLNSGAGDLVFKSTDSNVAFAVATNGNNVEVDAQLATNVEIDGNLTLNADDESVDSSIFFKRGDSEIPQIQYDQSASTFKLKRDNAGGLEVIMTQDDVPTTTVRGGVLLSGSTNTTGKILDVERLIYTQSADQSVEGKATGQASVYDSIRCVDGTDTLPESKSNHSHVLFRNKTGSTITVTNIAIVLLDSGTTTTDDYNFALVTYSSTANMVSNTIASADDLGAITRTTNYKTGYIESTGTRTVASGSYFGIKCTQECDGHLGHGLRVTIEATRSI